MLQCSELVVFDYLITLVFFYLLSQRLVKVVTTLLFELSFVLVRLDVRYLNHSLPNHSLCARQTRSSSKSYRTTEVSTLGVRHIQDASVLRSKNIYRIVPRARVSVSTRTITRRIKLLFSVLGKICQDKNSTFLVWIGNVIFEKGESQHYLYKFKTALFRSYFLGNC